LDGILEEIETAGLKIDTTQWLQHFDVKTQRKFKKDFVYSEYNPFTTTGRPSNRFGGVNFSALNKSNGSREVFISRYPNGRLVQMDFEAYHLRLVADELGITLPVGSLHTELAKVYFGTDDITDDLYAESKRKTFEIMYGMSDNTYNFELFEQIRLARSQYEQKSNIVLPSGVNVSVTDPTASKLFNYYVQSLEVVKTVPKLKQILDCLKNTHNHLILYTYDSILLDMEHYDPVLVNHIVGILEENKKFPVRTYTGTTYNNITEIRL
jgi:hypothetical protein